MARIVDLAQSDVEGTLCASTDEAEQKLEAMLDGFRTKGYQVEEEENPGEDYPRYVVNDGDQWIGTFTIEP